MPKDSWFLDLDPGTSLFGAIVGSEAGPAAITINGSLHYDLALRDGLEQFMFGKPKFQILSWRELP